MGAPTVGSDTSEPPQPPPPPANCSPNNLTLCAGDPAAPPEEPAAPIVVTLRDIASFRPATPGNGMEPGGWAVVGLPANFVAAASVEVVSGTLLGQPADVRFTPVGYRWSHSDGGIVESGSPGATWDALGQREFTPTPTSHAYPAPGEFRVELEVALRAEYRFAGSPWRSIAGTLAVTGPPQRVLVGEFDTVLTRGDCIADPSGPGC
ncbi:PKD domain-containing protein [Agromyces sp. NPDC004153]